MNVMVIPRDSLGVGCCAFIIARAQRLFYLGVSLDFQNFLFTNIHAKCILVTSLILNKDKERKRVNRFSGRELPYGERQQRVLTKSSASPVSE